MNGSEVKSTDSVGYDLEVKREDDDGKGEDDQHYDVHIALQIADDATDGRLVMLP